jgi:hypothetical protein
MYSKSTFRSKEFAIPYTSFDFFLDAFSLIEISVGFSIPAIDCYNPIPLIYSLVGIEQIAVEVLFSTSRTA